MRPPESRLLDPRLAHERLAAREYGAKSPREIDEDARLGADEKRRAPGDRPRITGSHADGTANRELIAALERMGLVADETDIDPDDEFAPLEHNTGILFRGVKPTIAAGAAAGTAPTLSISEGTDHAGRITLVVGTTPGTGLLATITFNRPLVVASYTISLSPADSDAASAAGGSVFSDFAAQTSTSWQLRNVTVLLASTSYHWWYRITEFEET